MSYLTDQEKAVIKYTMMGGDLLHCPHLGCTRTLHLKPVPISDTVAAVFGMSGETLARMHAEQAVKEAAGQMLRHLKGHSVLDWLRLIESGVAVAMATVPDEAS